MDDALEAESERQRAWKILVVDDDESVHQITRMVLHDFQFEGHPLELLHARSGSEARQLYTAHDDIAVVLLDVVMETEHAGLDFADYIRKEADDPIVRIVLRTGQAGQFAVREVMENYDINDFREKIELTEERMFVTLVSALRGYRRLRDIERMRREQVRLVEELTASNRKLEGFTHMASHDLQAPLRKIIWRLQRAQKAVNNNAGSETLTEELRSMDRYCRYLRGLLGDMVEYSRLGKEPVQLLETELNDVLSIAFNNLEALVRDSCGAVELPMQAAPVLGHPVLLATLFQNLIGNGLKFTRDDMLPLVKVSVDPVARMPDSGAAAVRIDVRDNGRGIEADSLAEIFEPFVREKASREVEGSGLGLSIVREIVAEHGGEITVQSAPGEGSTFSVYLQPA